MPTHPLTAHWNHKLQYWEQGSQLMRSKARSWLSFSGSFVDSLLLSSRGYWFFSGLPVFSYHLFGSVQFSSVTQSCPTLCDPMGRSTPGLPIHHQFPELTQTHVHWVGDAIQPSHPLSSPFPPAFHLSQRQGLFKWVSPLHQVAKVLEFQLQHQSFQWSSRTDLL